MNCKKANRLIILDLYGELKDVEKSVLQEHLKGCPDCAHELDLTKKVLAVMDAHRPAAEPAADWSKAWDRIQAAIVGPAVQFGGQSTLEGRQGPRDFPAGPLEGNPSKGFPSKSDPAASPRSARATGWRWAYAGTGLAIVLIVGIFIGRYVLAPSPERNGGAVLSAAPPPNGIGPAFAAYLEDIKPILLDYAHYIPGEKSRRLIPVDENVLRGLVIQNILLKRKLTGKDPAAADLLEDLDLILKEITNRGPQEPQDPARIKDLIERRGVFFKMEIMKKL